MEEPGRPDFKTAFAFLKLLFLNRLDVTAVLAPWKKPCPALVGDKLDDLLRGHLGDPEASDVTLELATKNGTKAHTGKWRLGSYVCDQQAFVRWLCLDFDGGGHASPLRDPLAAAIATMKAARALGIHSYLERSGGGQGWHVWVFFAGPVHAAKARALGLLIAPKDAPLATVGVADPEKSQGIEVFPKSVREVPKGFGNLVWLPFWTGAPNGANQFYAVSGDGTVTPHFPREVVRVPEAAIDQILLDRVEKEPPESGAKIGATASKHSGGADAWKTWRKEALAALQLQRVYGEFLTGGKSGIGWLECRDPWSKSGDKSPSASVSDGSSAEPGMFHSFVSGKSMSVFDFLIERGGAHDFVSAAKLVADMTGVALPARQKTSSTAAHDLPEIQVNDRQLTDTVALAWKAIHKANEDPRLFRHGNVLTRVIEPKGVPRMDYFTVDIAVGHLARVARWFESKEVAGMQIQEDVHPDRDTARDVLVNPDPELPGLSAIITAPAFDKNLKLVCAPGYHEDSELWLHLDPGLEIPTVSAKPSDEEVKAVVDLLLNDLLGDFPFASASDKAHFLAALFMLFMRNTFQGCSPMHLIEASTPGTGKGLLCDILWLLVLGSLSEPTTISKDEDEARKKITSILLRAAQIIQIDNLKDALDSAQLAAVITAPVWTDRILGHTKDAQLPNLALWLLTGNNPRLSMENARRCVRVRLDARCDRPWLRTGFKHPNLKSWVRENRGKLIHAILTICQNWIAKGHPAGKQTIGTFESWAETMGGILEAAGIPGFLGNLEDLYEKADVDGQEWRDFVEAWWGKHGDAWVTASALRPLAIELGLLLQIIGDKGEISQRIRLGKALAGVRDRHFEKWRVEAGEDAKRKAGCYRLVLSAPGDGDDLHEGQPGTPGGAPDPQSFGMPDPEEEPQF